MLEANKSAVFEKFFAVYNRNLLKRRFHSCNVYGLSNLLNKNSQFPLIIYCNHSSWWDGLVAFQISHKTKLDSFMMMEEKQLKDLFLFRKLGAFSVVREKPREAMQSIDYAAKIMSTNSNATLWIFPQGEILPNDLRPIKFFRGLTKIIEKLGVCETTSLSLRYEFAGEFKPQIFVKIDMPEKISSDEISDQRNLTEIFAKRLTDNLDALKNDVLNRRFSGYENIL